MKNSVLKFVLVAGLALSAGAVSAEVLYWTVENPMVYVNAERRPEEMKSAAQLGAEYARVVAGQYNEAGEFEIKGTLKILAYDDIDEALVSTGMANVKLTDGQTGQFWADLGDWAGEGWYYQLQLGEKLMVGSTPTFDMTVMTDAIAYGDLMDYISDNEYFMELTTPWSGSGYIVPEPTGGMLMLLGCLVLGLKRKMEVA